MYIIIINLFSCMLGTNIYKYADVQEYKYTDIHEYEYTNIHEYKLVET